MAINKNKVMDAGRKAYEKGQFDKAIREYMKIVKEDPKDVRVWLKIGDLYAKKDAKQEATETYMKVASFYSEQGFYLKAVAVYKQILKVDPRLVEVNLKLAELYRQLGLLSDAMQHFEMVAAFFHREGKSREALATLRQLVDLDPENVATRIKLAELYSKEGMNKEAISEFTVTCDHLRKANRQDDFIKVAERLLFHDADNIDLCKELATLYLRKNDPRRALAKLQICFKSNQKDPSTLGLLAQAFQRLDQKAKTVSVLKELVKVHVEAGQKQKAADVHRKILEYVPNDPDSLAFLGEKARPSSMADSVEFDLPDEVSVSAPPPQKFGGNKIGRTTGSVPLVQPPAGQDELSLGSSDVEHIRTTSENLGAELDIGSQGGYEQRKQSSVETQEHADEIVKILTETDVYVKYGLNQKAIDHLRRVFALDEYNVEARERLQEILIEEGREAEGIKELLILAEHTVMSSPDKAADYLRKVLAIDAGNAEAHDFAQRHGLQLVAGEPRPSSNPNGELALADDPLDLDGFEAVPAQGSGAASVTRKDDVDYDFGQQEAPQQSNGVTMEVDVNQVEAAVALQDGDGDDLDFDLAPPPDPYSRDPLAAPADPLSPPNLEDDLAFDPADAAAFDADTRGLQPGAPDHLSHGDIYGQNGGGSYGQNPGAPVPSVDETEMAELEELDMDDLEELDEADLIEEDFEGGGFDSDYAMPAQTASPPAAALPQVDVTQQDMDLHAPAPTPHDLPTRAVGEEPAGGSSLEDDLDEADFFLSQGLLDEAREILQSLNARYPNHPLVLSKTEELQQAELGDGDSTAEENLLGDFDADALLGDDLLSDPAGTDFGRAPSVVLENPVEDDDADTHFDLGLAYKEMGLYGEAIQAFDKVMSNPGREVQCRLMIGLCHREQNNLSEAINQFKAALYVDGIGTAEKFDLYYEIGLTYEGLQDPQEALYYYEMVLKKQPEYRDVAERVNAIKAAVNLAGA